MAYIFDFCKNMNPSLYIKGRQNSLFCWFLLFGVSLIVGGWWAVGCYRKFYIGSAEIASFSNRGFSQSNKYGTFWHVVSTEYFCVLVLWAITVTDFYPLETYKNLGLPLPTITFTVNSHANNHFYKYIYFKY